MAPDEGDRPEMLVVSALWGEDVLCVVVGDRRQVGVGVNVRYSDGLKHAMAHVRDGVNGVVVCSPGGCGG